MIKIDKELATLWVGYHRKLGLVIYDPTRRGHSKSTIYLHVTATGEMVGQPPQEARAQMMATKEYAESVGKDRESVLCEFDALAQKYLDHRPGSTPHYYSPDMYGKRAYDPSSGDYQTNIFHPDE